MNQLRMFELGMPSVETQQKLKSLSFNDLKVLGWPKFNIGCLYDTDFLGDMQSKTLQFGFDRYEYRYTLIVRPDMVVTPNACHAFMIAIDNFAFDEWRTLTLCRVKNNLTQIISGWA